jgi:hypothetical protein
VYFAANQKNMRPSCNISTTEILGIIRWMKLTGILSPSNNFGKSIGFQNIINIIQLTMRQKEATVV